MKKLMLCFIGAVSKVKIFYHKVRKDFSQSSQRFELQHLKFVFFVLSLCSLWLKRLLRQPLLSISQTELCVYNMQGIQVKCLPVTERGTVDIQIQAGQLSAGVYNYFLIGDGKTSDTKQMILTK